MPTLEAIVETKKLLWTQLYAHWLSSELFTFTWWFGILFFLVCYVIWWKLVDKSRLIELLLHGSLLAVISSVADIVADNLILWQYPVKFFPFTPALFPFHLTLLPIILMIVYQYTNNWRQYFTGTVIASVVYSFIILPIFAFVGEIKFYNWNYGYSFIAFILRSLIAYGAIMLCKQIQCSYEGRSEFSHRFTPICQPTAKPLPDTKSDKEGGAEK